MSKGKASAEADIEKATKNMSDSHPLKKAFKQALSDNSSLEVVLNYESSEQYKKDYLDYVKNSREELLQAKREGKDKEEDYYKKFSSLVKDIVKVPDGLGEVIESQISFLKELELIRSQQKPIDEKILQRSQTLSVPQEESAEERKTKKQYAIYLESKRYLEKATKNMSDSHPLKKAFNQALSDNTSLQKVINYAVERPPISTNYTTKYQADYMNYIISSKNELSKANREGNKEEYQKKYDDLVRDLSQTPAELSRDLEFEIIRTKYFLQKNQPLAKPRMELEKPGQEQPVRKQPNLFNRFIQTIENVTEKIKDKITPTQKTDSKKNSPTTISDQAETTPVQGDVSISKDSKLDKKTQKAAKAAVSTNQTSDISNATNRVATPNATPAGASASSARGNIRG
jgi:hypothetical protein